MNGSRFQLSAVAFTSGRLPLRLDGQRTTIALRPRGALSFQILNVYSIFSRTRRGSVGAFAELCRSALPIPQGRGALLALIAFSAVVSVLTTWFGIQYWGAVAALNGQVAGECVNLVGLGLLLWRQAKLVRSDTPDAGPRPA